jgi:glycosyltransferase involved in cell wall biosynthesis
VAADDARARILFCVHSNDLGSGRGDIRAAAGLSRALASCGYRVAIAERERWSRLPAADLIVSLLPAFDPAGVPAGTPVIAWACDETEAWAALAPFAGFDAVLTGSRAAAEIVKQAYTGPVGVLPVGVDTTLFRPSKKPRAADAVATPAEIGQRNYFALPDLYRDSLVAVVEPVAAAVAPAGSQLSQLFESLACGAMPVTSGVDRHGGLADVGLAEVPVYQGNAERDRVVQSLCADPAATMRLAGRFGDQVLREHSWQRRAAAFLGHVSPLLGRTRGMPPANRQATIGFFPDYRAGNPYQDLLYADLRRRGVAVLPVNAREAMVPRDPGGKLDGYALHLHWTAPLLQAQPGPFGAELALRRFRQRIGEFRSRGGQLVWTVHNVLPHECPNRAAELALCEFLAERADLIHVMGADTAQIVAPLYQLPGERTVVIPHASYVGVYPDQVSRVEARRRLGLREHEVALVTLGGIRPYKGLGRLLDVFDELSRSDPRLRLLVVGKPANVAACREWQRRCELHARVIAHFDHADDADIQVWCRAADLAVLPYLTILNSGSYQLALSFDLPVVAPHDGTLAALLDPAYSVAFAPGSASELRGALATALARLVGRSEVRQAVNTAARTYPPDAMARDFAAAVLPLLAR